MDAKTGKQAGAFNLPGAVDSLGGNDFDQRNEGTVGDERADAGAVMERCGRRFAVDGRRCAGRLHAGLRVDGAHGRTHGADVVGRGAATAADDLRSSGDGFAREAGHVFRRAEVDVAAFDGAGHAGVGHCRKRQSGGGAHGFNSGENGCRAGGAVDSDGARAPLGEQRGGLGGGCAIEAVALVVHRHHHQHGQVGSGFAGGGESFVGLVEGGHGFEDQQVDAGICEGFDLLREGGAGFVEPGFAEGFEAHSQRADGASDIRFAGLLFLEMRNGLACHSDAGGVDFSNFAGQAVAGKAKAVGAEGVGFKNLSAGLQVLLMDGEDEARVGEIQLVVAPVDEDAAGIEHSAHGAVGQYGTVGKNVGKLGHPLVMLRHTGEARQSTGPLCYTSLVIAFINRPSNRASCNLSDRPATAITVFTFAAVTPKNFRGPVRAFRRGKGF